MLPGITGMAGRSGPPPVVTVFYKSSGNIIVPDVTRARVTIFGTGGSGSSDFRGGGGACSQSVIAVVPGEKLDVVVTGSSQFEGAYPISTIQRAGTNLVSAEGGTYGRDADAGGRAAQGIGQVRFSGSYGGAAGTLGDASGHVGGPGATFTQTSNGEVATNGWLGRSYGGGGGDGGFNPGSPGIIIIEWGFRQ